MKKTLVVMFIAAAAAILNMSVSAPENQARAIIARMIKATETYKTCTYTMRSEERLTGQKALRGGDIFTKVSENPRKTYMKMITDPNKGTEILYVEGERANKALVNPGKFLPTVTLAPANSMITKDQHHTLLSAGFRLAARIIDAGVKRSDGQGRFDEAFKYAGDITWNGHNCYKIIITDPTWSIITYTAKKGENISTISSKLLVSEYSIAELNSIKSFDEDLGGKTLKVPSSYAKTSVFYIDKQNDFPVYQEMSDDKGVYERYQFFNLVINPTFKADEFTKSFPEYKF